VILGFRNIHNTSSRSINLCALSLIGLGRMLSAVSDELVLEYNLR
jgi:hypothetical protein